MGTSTTEKTPPRAAGPERRCFGRETAVSLKLFEICAVCGGRPNLIPATRYAGSVGGLLLVVERPELLAVGGELRLLLGNFVLDGGLLLAAEFAAGEAP